MVISKELSKTREEYKSKQAHAELAARMAARDPGSAPKLGDRVPYVVISKGGGKTKAPLYDCAENPIYAIQHGLQLDTGYYIDNQVLEPLIRLFEPIFKSEKEVRNKLLKETYSGQAGVKILSKANNAPKNSMFAMLQKGQAAAKKVDVVTKRPMTSKDFFASKQTDSFISLSDETIMKGIKNGLTSDLYKMRLNTIAELMFAQSEFWRTKVQCSTCLCSFKKDNMGCANSDCNIFYKRLTTEHAADTPLEKLAELGSFGLGDLPEYVC